MERGARLHGGYDIAGSASVDIPDRRWLCDRQPDVCVGSGKRCIEISIAVCKQRRHDKPGDDGRVVNDELHIIACNHAAIAAVCVLLAGEVEGCSGELERMEYGAGLEHQSRNARCAGADRAVGVCLDE
jgi:hypothetical protein